MDCLLIFQALTYNRTSFQSYNFPWNLVLSIDFMAYLGFEIKWVNFGIFFNLFQFACKSYSATMNLSKIIKRHWSKMLNGKETKTKAKKNVSYYFNKVTFSFLIEFTFKTVKFKTWKGVFQCFVHLYQTDQCFHKTSYQEKSKNFLCTKNQFRIFCTVVNGAMHFHAQISHQLCKKTFH